MIFVISYFNKKITMNGTLRTDILPAIKAIISNFLLIVVFAIINDFFQVRRLNGLCRLNSSGVNILREFFIRIFGGGFDKSVS